MLLRDGLKTSTEVSPQISQQTANLRMRYKSPEAVAMGSHHGGDVSVNLGTGQGRGSPENSPSD